MRMYPKGKAGFDFDTFLADSNVLVRYIRKGQTEDPQVTATRNYFREVGFEPYVWEGITKHLTTLDGRINDEKAAGKDPAGIVEELRRSLVIAEALGIGEVPAGAENPDARQKLKSYFDDLVRDY